MLPSKTIMKLLIVDDEKKLARSIRENLVEEGYDVRMAHNGAKALSLIEKEEFSVVILDWRLPDISGLEVCRRIREKGLQPPIIMLTVMNTTEQRVMGLESGADDYLCKPFDMPELLARIRSLIRRSQADYLSPIEVDDLTLYPRTRKVIRGNQEIFLSNQEYELLEFLLRNMETPQSRKTILREVWGIHYNPQSNIVDVYINYLRKKIDVGSQRSLIQTIRGKGYKISRNP